MQYICDNCLKEEAEVSTHAVHQDELDDELDEFSDEDIWDDYEFSDLDTGIPLGSMIAMSITAIFLLLLCLSLFIPEFNILSEQLQIGNWNLSKEDIVYFVLIFGWVPLIDLIVAELSELDVEVIYISVIQLIFLAIINLLFTMNCGSELIIASTLIQLFAYIFSVLEYLRPKNKKTGNIFLLVGIIFYVGLIYLNQLPYSSFRYFLMAGADEIDNSFTQIIFQQESYTIIYLAIVALFYLATLVVVHKTKEKEDYLTSVVCYVVLLLRIVGLLSIFGISNVTIHAPFYDSFIDSILFIVILYNRFKKEL